MSSRIKKVPESLINAFPRTEIFNYIAYVVLSILVGLFAGGGGILFHVLLEQIQSLFEGGGILQTALRLPPYCIVLAPVLGTAVTSAMTFLAPELSTRRGVTEVIKAVILRHGFIPLREVVFHLAAPIISLGSGVPLGPEGPAAQIGSGAGSLMSQALRLGKRDMTMYTVAGAGAAISSVFNAPLAGVFFGIEVILANDMRNRALSALIIASVVANIITGVILGEGKIIDIPAYSLGELSTYPFFLGLAVFCGLTGLAYFALLDVFGSLFNDKLKISNPFLRILPVALVFGFVLTVFPQLYGVGYGTISDILNLRIPLAAAACLFLLKLVFMSLFLKAGAYGGTFAPSLVLGALAGYVFSEGVNFFFGTSLDTVAFSLVGMGGVLSAINSIPMTAILLVFEMTSGHSLMLHFMLVSVLSYLIVIYYRKGTVYAIDLLKDNIDISMRGKADLLSKVPAGSILRTDIVRVDYKTPIKGLADAITSSNYENAAVIGEGSSFKGMIALKDVLNASDSEDLANPLIAGDLSVSVPAATAETPLNEIIQRMNMNRTDNIPIVSSDGKNTFIGIITHGDIILSYDRMLDTIEKEQSLI